MKFVNVRMSLFIQCILNTNQLFLETEVTTCMLWMASNHLMSKMISSPDTLRSHQVMLFEKTFPTSGVWDDIANTIRIIDLSRSMCLQLYHGSWSIQHYWNEQGHRCLWGPGHQIHDSNICYMELMDLKEYFTGRKEQLWHLQWLIVL